MRKQSGGMFALKFLSLLAVVAVLMIGINAVYVNGFYYSDTYGEVQKFNNVPTGITLANTGTSHGLASFRYPDDLAETTFNFALSGEDIYHDFQTLKQFSDHIADECVIAIPTSYFSFCMSVDEPSQKRYYAYMDKEYLRGFSYETLINAKYLPVLRSGEYLFKDLINDQAMDVGGMMMEADAAENDTASDVAAAIAARETMEAELHSHAVGRAESWRSGFMIIGENNMPANRQLLIDMVNYCKEQGWKPVLITTPVHYTLNEAFTEEELEHYYFSNTHAVQEATGVPYYDMSHDETFANTPEYYSNSDHLNKEGGDAFTAAFLGYLTEIGYR